MPLPACVCTRMFLDKLFLRHQGAGLINMLGKLVVVANVVALF